MTSAPRLTLQQQAEFVEALVMRCHPYNGGNAGPALLSLELVDVEIMRELAARLKRMAPHEPDIKRMVVGR
ncbi:hypothetical protein [Hyphomicrobium sp. 99]|uniref:hypothetical protein n=1 Tax=Hyphomicrobium sp. 99 TaxID=1163419 RepID=UPI0005F78CCC|nr:hypothetical protein [Hyphomicrobium sp. 99]